MRPDEPLLQLGVKAGTAVTVTVAVELGSIQHSELAQRTQTYAGGCVVV
jgi:hypothetical protein